MTNPTQVAVYLRVSTAAQDAANQVPDVERLCAARGWTIAHRYVETVSGAAPKRPELERLLADAHAGRFSVLVVWSLDRLSRRGIAEVASIVKRLDASGVALVSVREAWADTSGPVRELLVAVMAWVAEQERARLHERLSAARARLEKEGRSWGRPLRGLGQKDRERGVKPLDVERARRLLAERKSTREIAAALKVPRTTLRRALKGAR